MTLIGSDVIARLNLIFDDASNAKWSAAQKLEAVNAAIDSAWPELFLVAADTSVTVSSSTYSYTPAAAPEGGFRVAYATLTSRPDTLLRRVYQRQTGTDWEIMLPADLAGAFTGQTLELWYQARCARLTLVTDAIDAILPLDYLWQSAAMTLAMVQMVKGASFETSPYEALVVAWTKNAALAKRNAASALRPLPMMIHDFGDPLVVGNDPHAYHPFMTP